MRVVTTLSVVVLASAGIGHAVVTSLDADIARVDPFKDMKNRPRAGHGMNVLLVGTDGRDKITETERLKYRLGGAPCHCTDTIMIVHISEDRGGPASSACRVTRTPTRPRTSTRPPASGTAPTRSSSTRRTRRAART